jgi:hypothetical protein
VCQIHTKAVLQLRAKLADRPEGSGRRADGPGAKATAGAASGSGSKRVPSGAAG